MNHCEFKAHNAMWHGARVVYVNRREFEHPMQCGMVHVPELAASGVAYVSHCEFKRTMQCGMVHEPKLLCHGWCM